MYLSKVLDNGIFFFFYRVEPSRIRAAYCFDEKRYTHNDAVKNIITSINEATDINANLIDITEVTMFTHYQNLQEMKRRLNGGFFYRYIDDMGLWIHYPENKEHPENAFSFDERIVPEKTRINSDIYDRSFSSELINIAKNRKSTYEPGNIVHYVIASRSFDASCDMSEVLVQHLIKANRLNNRRLEIISDIHPVHFANNEHFESVIENNYGGAVLIDLSEKLGYKPTEYGLVADYLERIVRKNRNNCLFIFTYNMDNTGFAYNLLQRLSQYITSVNLREGTGNRRAGIIYMQELVSGSDISCYKDKVKEFIDQKPDTRFTQTDIINLMDSFDVWCRNGDAMKAYISDLESFRLDKDENTKSSYDQLMDMTGLTEVKSHINAVISEYLVEKERKKLKGSSYEASSMHMIFSGDPGTAKTTVAKLFAGIAKEKGILKSGIFVEESGTNFGGMGAEFLMKEAFDSARGGVLFIDEAYAITSYGAVTIMLQEMENHRDDVIVILAGYREKMQEFLKMNEGLKSRIPHTINFPNYSTDELMAIFKVMVKERGFRIKADALTEADYIFDKARCVADFGNGRFARNLVDDAVRRQSARIMSGRENADGIPSKELFTITKEDVMEKGKSSSLATSRLASEELSAMIGLTSAKSVINKALAAGKVKKLCMEKNIPNNNMSFHMVFTGNPGTAKTTVARLFARILKEERILATGNFIEAGRADLIGKYEGQTAPLVKKKFMEAQGGVLFIDEAYSLSDSHRNSFGDEAINTIVQEMENHRDDVIVIFAGYPKPMDEFLERNPGMKSRIAYHVDFEDYTVDELYEICKLMLKDRNLTATSDALIKLRENLEAGSKIPDYGNGRYVRQLLEDTVANRNTRITSGDLSRITEAMLTTIEGVDVPVATRKVPAERTWGFAG